MDKRWVCIYCNDDTLYHLSDKKCSRCNNPRVLARTVGVSDENRKVGKCIDCGKTITFGAKRCSADHRAHITSRVVELSTR